MVSEQQIENVVLESLAKLNTEKQEGQKIPVSDETILLGSGTLLDSLDFIVIITDIEEQLNILTGREYPLTVDLQAFDEDNPFRTVATLRKHIGIILDSS
jgi:acyl carrier protein